MSRATVVGAGPNGLTAAVVLAEAGLDVTILEAEDRVGGGARSAELTVPGVLHDICSAVHPFGVASPVFRTLGLTDHGLRWLEPDVAVAHPVDGGRAASLVRSLEGTVALLGQDGRAWEQLFGRTSRHFDQLAHDLLRPVFRLPRYPVTTVLGGLTALLPAAVVARRFADPLTRALWGGIAAHAIQPFSRLLSSGAGSFMVAAGHAAGWAVAAGGSQAITDALVARLTALGARIETGVRVTSARDLPPAQVTMLDLSPGAVAGLGLGLPSRVERAYRRFRHGPAAFKVDYAVEGGVPWEAEAPRHAGTVHLGGSFEEIAHAEREVAAGRMPERPFVLVAQQSVADPSRAAGDVHPLWAYAHVPHGYTGDATGAIESQLERFAPGFRERVVGRHVSTPRDLEAHDANYVGGDIAGGASSPRQMVARPRLAWDPYATGVRGVYLCSASTPPGAGVHGLPGWHAAHSALRHLPPPEA